MGNQCPYTRIINRDVTLNLQEFFNDFSTRMTSFNSLMQILKGITIRVGITIRGCVTILY